LGRGHGAFAARATDLGLDGVSAARLAALRAVTSRLAVGFSVLRWFV
jgi:hypothetical protein